MRDYLYISIGGNKQGVSKEYRNLFVTMLVAGLWHGASWLFVVWGALHGLFLVVEHFIKTHVKLKLVSNFIVSNSLIAMTFLLVTLAWIPFRSPDVFVAINVLTSLFGNENASLTGILERIEVIVIISSLFIGQIFMKYRDIEGVIASQHWIMRGVLLTVFVVSIMLVEGGDSRAFIYFQF
jgi:alginate O-acetyltransferase complex protein AlgI